MKRSGSSHINYYEIAFQSGLNDSMDFKKNERTKWLAPGTGLNLISEALSFSSKFQAAQWASQKLASQYTNETECSPQYSRIWGSKKAFIVCLIKTGKNCWESTRNVSHLPAGPKSEIVSNSSTGIVSVVGFFDVSLSRCSNWEASRVLKSPCLK